MAAWARAHAGDEALARTAAGQALELAERTSGDPAWFFATSALGQHELARGDAATAHAVLEPLVDFVRGKEMCEPGATWCVADEIDALVELDRSSDAEELLDCASSSRGDSETRRAKSRSSPFFARVSPPNVERDGSIRIADPGKGGEDEGTAQSR